MTHDPHAFYKAAVTPIQVGVSDPISRISQLESEKAILENELIAARVEVARLNKHINGLDEYYEHQHKREVSQLESDLAAAKSEAAKQFLELKRREKEAFDNGIRASQLESENARLRAAIVLHRSQCDRARDLQKAKNKSAARLLAEWTRDTSGYDEAAWPDIKRTLEESRDSARPPFENERLKEVADAFQESTVNFSTDLAAARAEITRLKGQRDRLKEVGKRIDIQAATAPYTIRTVDHLELQDAIAESEAP